MCGDGGDGGDVGDVGDGGDGKKSISPPKVYSGRGAGGGAYTHDM